MYCYINEDFPVIATASRADLASDEMRDPDRYPIVHAVLKKRKIGEQYKFYVAFSVIGDYSDPLVAEVRNELMKFVSDTYDNKFEFEIDGKFYVVTDMSNIPGIRMSKYFVLPALPTTPEDI
jgi:hypothetical protein